MEVHGRQFVSESNCFYEYKSLLCVAILVRVHLCVFTPPLTLSIMKGLAKTLSTSHYLSDNRVFERKFC